MQTIGNKLNILATLMNYYDEKKAIQPEEMTKEGLIQILHDALKFFVYKKAIYSH